MSSARTTLIRFGAATLAAGAALGGAGTAAGAAIAAGSTGNSGPTGTGGSAAVPATLAGIKAKAATDITDRVNDLNAAISKVNAAKGLGTGQSTIAAYLGTDVSPLQQLNTTIQGDTTVKQAAHDFSTIFTDYRVYVLVLPAARIAAAADHATTHDASRPHRGLGQGGRPREPAQQRGPSTTHRRSEPPDRHRLGCGQRPGRHRARLHPAPVERQPRTALAGQVG